MIFIYGDSHAHYNFKNLPLSYRDYHQSSITMFRVGRDKTIINFNSTEHDSDSVICMTYGEVDCRCHVHRQINTGRQENDVIHQLVHDYFESITHNIGLYKAIIIIAVIPPTNYYTRADGTLKYELSDQLVHVCNNEVFLEEFIKLYNTI